MSNITVPAHIAALIAANPALANLMNEATSGISAGMPPTIVADKGKFVVKENGTEDAISFPMTLPDGTPHPAAGQSMSKIQGVVLRAKEGLEKSFYLTKYTPGQETTGPDCFSADGIKPDPASPHVQCASCAGCPQNVFGSGKNADGTPSKGKACADKKILVFYSTDKKGIYRFAVPPATLGTWLTYAKTLGAHSLLPCCVVTSISFDPQDDYKLIFNNEAVLGEAQIQKIIPLLDSPEVTEILNFGKPVAPALPAPPAQPALPQAPPAPTAETEFQFDPPAATLPAPPAAPKRGRGAAAAPPQAPPAAPAADPLAGMDPAKIAMDLGL